jgi:hypothetical protein
MDGDSIICHQRLRTANKTNIVCSLRFFVALRVLRAFVVRFRSEVVGTLEVYGN